MAGWDGGKIAGPRVLSMSDARALSDAGAFATHAKEITIRESRAKEPATRFLIKGGILTKDGKLAPMYRSRKGE